MSAIHQLTFFLLVSIFCVLGCRTSLQSEAESVLGSVAEAISGKDVSEEDIHNLEAEIVKDKETKKAVEAIAESMGVTSVKIKYCPLTGKRYAPHIETCPVHGVVLEIVEE